MAIDPTVYAAVKKELLELIRTKRCNPLMIRLAWHDSGTYDKNISSFPERGGANGSVRFKPECDHAANAGVINLVHMMNEIKQHHPQVSFADTFQLAAALSIEEAGGPKIPLRFGRVDVGEQTGCAKEGRLPGGGGPYPDGAPDAATHLRNVFYRMGLNDQEIVVLSGAHTLGRAYPSRSGFGKDKTKYTDKAVAEGATIGGSSWTKEWLKFDNSYFKGLKQQDDEHLLVLETDGVLMTDPKFRPWAIKYAEDEKLFFGDYAKAQVKLSELGSKVFKQASGSRPAGAGLTKTLWDETSAKRLAVQGQYVSKVVEVMDPDQELFCGMQRVIAQGSGDPTYTPQKHFIQGLAGTRAVSVVLDDYPNMWAAHSHSVLHAQPFHFFHAVRQAAAPGGSRRSSDAAAQDDMLTVASNIMLQVDSRHVQAVQQAASADQPLLVAEGHPMPAWDATLIMFQMRMQVLKGVKLVFSGLRSLECQKPEQHIVWKTAEAFGAECFDDFRLGVTHLATYRPDTVKVYQASAAGIPVVSLDWVTSCAHHWARLPEHQFPVRPMARQHG
ncbi:TPA: hypothetical protein ACH3X3_004639 [Trebouxia sp. C0006]